MTIEKQGLVMAAATTRRQFTGLLCGGGLLTLSGCGGGSSGSAPPVVAAKITLAPQSASGTLGQSITLRVEASGTDLTYQWRRNGMTLNGATGSSLQVVVTPADDGAQYTVVVSNSAGQMESTAAILTVKSSGVISLLAGGLGGSGMVEGRGTQARLPSLGQVVASKDGSVYFGGERTGKVSAQGDVTFLPDFPGDSAPFFLGMACDSKGDLYAIGRGSSVIYKLVNGAYVPYAGASDNFVSFLDGVGTAARLRYPQSPAFDSQDNLYFIDSGNHAVRKVAPGGVVTTVAGMPSNVTLVDGKGSTAGFASPRVLLVLADDSLLLIDGNSWRKVLPDGTVSTLAGAVPSDVAAFTMQGVAIDALYAVRGHSVVKLALDGSTTLVAGNTTDAGYVDGVGATARFNAILSLSLSATGELFVADRNPLIRRINLATGEVSAWAGMAPQPGRVDGEGAQARFATMGPSCVDTNGNVYVVDIQAKTLCKIAVAGASSGTGVVSTLFTNFPSQGDVAVDASGNFYGVRDRAIIKVLPSGAQEVFAGQPGVLGFADGMGSAASFARPGGLTLDSAGNLYVGDEPDRVRVPGSFSGVYSDTYGGTLRRITPSGLVSTLAGTPGRVTSGSIYGPTLSITDDASYFVDQVHLASDTDGVIWVSSDYGIRRVGGAVGAPVWILKGHSGTDRPCASDGAGGLWVAYGKVIRKVLPNGTSTVVAGVEDARIVGVKLGALPGSLGPITSVVAASPNVLYCGSENAVLRIQLS